jgi:isocitrate dehydrogenase
MMKVSDPIMFGHAVEVYFADVFAKHADTFKELDVLTKNGLGDLLAKVDTLEASKKNEIVADINACMEKGAKLAMVDSDRGITNLHYPNDIIIDASVPAAFRTSGQMWNADGKPEDTIAMIPDRSYARMYQTVVDFSKANGAFDPKTMGSVANVGLMAKKAEEYGSHDKTFELPAAGMLLLQTSQELLCLSMTLMQVIFGECVKLKISLFVTG